jgi:ribosomal protein S14
MGYCCGLYRRCSTECSRVSTLPTVYKSLLMCRASVRALGETDLNPVSGLGKISQLLFAWIQPGNIVANIIAGGVAEAGAQQ